MLIGEILAMREQTRNMDGCWMLHVPLDGISGNIHKAKGPRLL